MRRFKWNIRYRSENIRKIKKNFNFINNFFLCFWILIFAFIALNSIKLSSKILFGFIVFMISILQILKNWKHFIFSFFIILFLILFFIIKNKIDSAQFVDRNIENIEARIFKKENKYYILSTKKYGNLLLWRNNINFNFFIDDSLWFSSKLQNLENDKLLFFYKSNKINYIINNFQLLKINSCNNSVHNVFYKFIENKPEYFKKYFSLILFSYQLEEFNIKTKISDLNIIHLIAISGMHFNLLYKIIYSLFYKIKNQNLKNNLTIWILFYYLIFIKSFISAFRAFIMIIWKLKTKELNKKTNLLDSLSISAIFVFIFNPYCVFSYSFIFSFLISFFILIFNSIFKNLNINKYLKWFIFLLMIYIFISPMSIYVNKNLNIFGIFWILIFSPIFELLFSISIAFFYNFNLLNFLYMGLEKILNFAYKNSYFLNFENIKIEYLYLYYALFFSLFLYLFYKTNKQIKQNIKI
ncbi:MAG: MAG0480 family ComEC-like protein [Metamycoplasmataceae bacterium]